MRFSPVSWHLNSSLVKYLKSVIYNHSPSACCMLCSSRILDTSASLILWIRLLTCSVFSKITMRWGNITSAKKWQSSGRYTPPVLQVAKRQYRLPFNVSTWFVLFTWHFKNKPEWLSTNKSYTEGISGKAIALKWRCSTADARYSPAWPIVAAWMLYSTLCYELDQKSAIRYD